jgi:hypothetical protein
VRLVIVVVQVINGLDNPTFPTLIGWIDWGPCSWGMAAAYSLGGPLPKLLTPMSVAGEFVVGF